MKPIGLLLAICSILLLSSCKKEVNGSEYEGDYNPYASTYKYFHLSGTVYDSLGVPMDSVFVHMNTPCSMPRHTDSLGNYRLTACELSSKFSYSFPDSLTVFVNDSTSNFTPLGQRSFYSSILIQDETVIIDVQL